jgi:putative hemolysin
MGISLELLAILALTLLNGFFACAEIAVLTARRNRLEQSAAAGSSAARAALILQADTGRFLSTVQVGITGVSTFAAAYGGVRLVSQVSHGLSQAGVPWLARNSDAVSLAVVTGAIAFLSLVLGELVPKRLALAYAESLARIVALPMWVLSVVARPAVALLQGVTAAILWMCRVRPGVGDAVTIDDIEHLLESGVEQGVLQQTEQEVALEALQLKTRRARDVMRSRTDIDAVDIDTPSSEVVGAVAMSGFSRLPVYEGDLDHVLGFVYNKDLFQQVFMGREIDLRRMLRDPLFIPENLALDRLLLRFQERRTQLAIVLDEFGGTSGMVTFEDVLEELVGEIHDEHRLDEHQRVVQRDANSWYIDGLLPLHDMLAHLPAGTKLSPESRGVSIVAGIVVAAIEDLPKIGDVVQCGDLRIEVVDMDGKRIDRVLLTIAAEDAD